MSFRFLLIKKTTNKDCTYVFFIITAFQEKKNGWSLYCHCLVTTIESGYYVTIVHLRKTKNKIKQMHQIIKIKRRLYLDSK